MCKDDDDCYHAAQIVIQAILPSGVPKELSFISFDGERLEGAAFFDQLLTKSLFSPQRLFWIKHADKIKKDLVEEISQYLSKPVVGHYILMTASSIPKTSLLYKKIEKEGIILDLPELKPWENEKRLVEWVGHYISSKRKVISFPVSQALVRSVGQQQTLLTSELDKLLCYIGDRNEITLQDVHIICSHFECETIWKLGEAIFSLHAANALNILSQLMREDPPFLPFLRQIRAQFQTELQICSLLASGHTGAQVSEQFPYMKGQILEKHIQMARHYGMDRFLNGLLAIDAIEMESKTSSHDEKLLAELLILQLTQ